MDCVTCESLERAFESRRSQYFEAVSAPHYLVSPKLAARKLVDMEQAKGAMEDHRSICVGYAETLANRPRKRHKEGNRERAVRVEGVRKTYGQRLAHPYEYSKSLLGLRSASFFQSLTTAILLGAIAAVIGVVTSAALYSRHLSWYISAAAGPLVDTLVVVCLATIALEQGRKLHTANSGTLHSEPPCS